MRKQGKALYSRKIAYARSWEKRVLARRKGVEYEEIEEHPLLEVFDYGNAFLSGAQVRFLTQGWLLLTGTAYWIIARNKMGVPVEIYPVPETWVTKSVNGDYYSVAFAGSKVINVPAEDVIKISDPSLEDPYNKGVGYGMALGDEIDTDEFTAKYTKMWFENNARPDLLITAEGLTPRDTERLEIEWLNKLKGLWKAHRPFFLAKDVKVHELSKSFQDMQLVELRKFERDAIIQTFGVPPELFGVLQNSNRATIEAADFLFSRWVLLPRLEMFRDVLQRFFVPLFDEKLIIDYENPVNEDREFILNVVKAMPWAFTKNEIRELAGFDGIGEAGDVFYMPLTIVPSDKSFGAGAGAVSPIKGVLYPNDDEAQKRWEYLKAEYWDKTERRWLTEMRRIFQAQQNEVMDKLKNAKGIQKWTVDDVLFDRRPYDEQMVSFARSVSIELIRNAAIEAQKEVGVAPSFDVIDERVITWINQRAGTLIKGINDTTLNELRATLAEGIALGEGIPKLADRVSAVFKKAKGPRAENIARTETIAAFTRGTVEGYRASGVVQKVQFWTALDERVCPECMSNHGAVYEISDNSILNKIPVHPQCRCVWLPIV